MNKPHLPTLEEVKALQNIKTIYVTLEINPDTIKDRVKKIHDVSKLEREAKMLDTYFVKKRRKENDILGKDNSRAAT